MSTSWPAKDPDAVLDYTYRIPLDAGDSVASYTLESIAGTVAIDDESLAGAPDTTDKGYGQDLTAWLSGGVAGEASVFRITWTTDAGRTPDPVSVVLQVAESDYAPLVLTGYAKPAAAHLVMRYPAFAAVPASTIQYWLTDAERAVDQSWTEGDYAAALMALAAHNMTLAGLGADAAALANIPAGLNRMKSGSLELGFTDAAANARAGGELTSTRYGQEYRALLLRNRGGPRVTGTGVDPAWETPYRVGAPW